MMTWQEIEEYCKERLQEVEAINHVSHTPSALCCLAAFVGYLSRLAYYGAPHISGVTYGSGSKIHDDEDAFSAFIVKFLPLYSNYYTQDSNTGRKHFTLYTVLRCGIVHSMSFYDKWKPNASSQPSLPLSLPAIVVTHSTKYSTVGTPLLYAPNGPNAIVINAFDLCREVRIAIASMFADADVRINAENFIKYQPPIRDLFNNQLSSKGLTAPSVGGKITVSQSPSAVQAATPTQNNELSG